jgi:hypothetical protein
MTLHNKVLWWVVTVALVGCGGGGVDERAGPTSAAEMTLQFQHTDSLALAREIRAQGRQPIFDATALLLDLNTKRLRADAGARLDRAHAEHPGVLDLSGLMIEVVDEVFLSPEGTVSTPAQQRLDLKEALDAIALLRARFPRAKLGVVVAPEAWLADANVVGNFDQLLLHLDWAATDTYFWTTNVADAQVKLRAAREFANHVAQRAPAVKRWIVVQGFAPIDFGPNPAQWDADKKSAFSALLGQLFGIGAAQYHGAVVWGWNLPDSHYLKPFRVFPEGLKKVYRDGLATQCLSGASEGNSDVAETAWVTSVASASAGCLNPPGPDAFVGPG